MVAKLQVFAMVQRSIWTPNQQMKSFLIVLQTKMKFQPKLEFHPWCSRVSRAQSTQQLAFKSAGECTRLKWHTHTYDSWSLKQLKYKKLLDFTFSKSRLKKELKNKTPRICLSGAKWCKNLNKSGLRLKRDAESKCISTLCLLMNWSECQWKSSYRGKTPKFLEYLRLVKIQTLKLSTCAHTKWLKMC